MTLDTFGSDYDTVLSVHQENGICASLSSDACNDDAGFFVLQSQVSLPVTAGVFYDVKISEYDGPSCNAQNLVLNARYVLAGDECAAPTEILATPFTDTVDTTAATTAASDPLQSCTFGGPRQNSNSVWYRFTAPGDGTVTADTAGSRYDTVLTAYTGGCGALTEVRCNDDSALDLTSVVSFGATAGTSYLLEVTHYGTGTGGGSLAFTLDFVPESNCCTEHAGTGCESAPCVACVCAEDEFCCTAEWDEFCAGEAADPSVCAASCPCGACGDGVVNFGEECDDGNTAAGDCCGPTCRLEPVGSPCEADGAFCTGDACDALGRCEVVRNFCDDSNPCNGVERCEPPFTCVPGEPAPAGTPCEADENRCTVDACDGQGGCVIEQAVSCDDQNACTDDFCAPAIGCLNVANAAPCDDGDACTVGDLCRDGSCVAGLPRDCDDGKPCTREECLPPSGCFITPLPNGTACEDVLFCNGVETCRDGDCGGGTPPCPPGQCDEEEDRCARATCGDVNGDEGVNIGDGQLVAQFDVGLRQCGVAPFVQPETCDINPQPTPQRPDLVPDGECNIGDALKMAQCDVGLIGCEFVCAPFACPAAMQRSTEATPAAVARLVLPPGTPPPGTTVTGDLVVDVGEAPLGAYRIDLACDERAVEIVGPIAGGVSPEFSGPPVQALDGCGAHLAAFNTSALDGPTGTVSVAQVELRVKDAAALKDPSAVALAIRALFDTSGAPIGGTAVAESCANGTLDAGEACDFATVPAGCGAEEACQPDCTCAPCAARLGVGDAASVGEGEFCVDLTLTNPAGVRGVEATLVDMPDELTLTRVDCAERTPGFTCDAHEVAGTNRIRLLVLDLGGRCIEPGAGPIARVCLKDAAPVCAEVTEVTLQLTEVQVADCVNEPVATCTGAGTVLCPGLLGDCEVDGDLDMFDVNHKIDLVLGRVAVEGVEAILCDDDCDEDIDIFDIVREIDVVLERVPLPLECPGPADLVTRRPAGARLKVRERGRALVLRNRREPVRGVELTLEPVGGPVAVISARGTKRTNGFTVDFHQPAPTAPVRVVIVSLEGAAIRPGRGRIVRLKTVPGSTRARLRLRAVKVAP